ncbi:bile acid:sodium symporter family protein [Alkalimonas collagenimarina]|uniref:Bile acid:sodium symporter family protein n=1 Tax=Alkalimonas collagenimarina TaxID=400390 RepID=A0ABT9GVD4_9GAMM|nr:bile acid:sodium symporter family protein [Alkalimonas collagenimarina]MDP4535017.1 bile acid:sodium symporter family protein [Alkalimonas collagenimarina]
MEATIFTQIFLPVALAVIMLGMGLSLKPVHFKQLWLTPKPVLTGLSLQIIAIPMLAFLLAWGLRLPPELAVGLVLIAACPGGPTSNLIAHLAHADMALSISLTALSSLVVIITLPLLINFASLLFLGEGQYVALPVLRTIAQLLIIIVVPVSLGMWLKARFPQVSKACVRPVKFLSSLFLVMVVAGVLFGEKDRILGFFVLIGIGAALLNIASMLVGYIGGKLAGCRGAQIRSLTIEVGIQNGTLGIAIATSPLLLNNSTMAIPSAVYSLIMFASGGLMILWGYRKKHA